MPPLVDVVGAAVDDGRGAIVEAVFGHTEAAAVASSVEAYVARACGASVHEALWWRSSVGIVIGLALTDGRRVVVKLHRWNADLQRLSAVHTARVACADAGLPAPRPVAPPEALCRGVATVEQLVDADRPDATRHELCDQLASELVRLVRTIAPSERLGRPPILVTAATGSWPEPHDVRFDFAASSSGAAWIDDAWVDAQRRLASAARLPDVVGHFDWRVENLGFDGARITAIFDWDAIAVAPEAAVVGVTAGHWTSDWTSDEEDTLPSVSDMRAFVDAYERHRGRAFAATERRVLDAANLALVAYGARCQHSDHVLRPEAGVRTDARWLRLLRDRGECLW